MKCATPPPLKCPGVGRDKDCINALQFYFSRPVTDDEMRFMHEVMNRVLNGLSVPNAGGSMNDLMNMAAAEMPRYKCHKQVWALKIAAIEILADKSAKIAPKDAGYAPFEAKPGWADRWKGSEGDLGYYVVYDDGFASWSPTKAFEEGYTRVAC